MTLVRKPLMAVAAGMRRWPSHKTFLWNHLKGFLKGSGSCSLRFPAGYWMRLDMNISWERDMLAGCFERRLYWLIRRLLRPGDIFIDGGAYIGYFSCLAGALVKQGQVHAFEPNPSAARRLREQIKLNPSFQIILHEEALGRELVEAWLMLPSDNFQDEGWHATRACLSTSPRFRDNVRQDWLRKKVLCNTLDNFISRQRLPRIALCKVDLEGEELSALVGARKVLSTGILESLAIEVCNETREALIKELGRYRFDFILDADTLKPLEGLRQMPPRMTNVLLLRGACVKRWRELAWQRWFL